MSSLLLRGYSDFASGSHVLDWFEADRVIPEIIIIFPYNSHKNIIAWVSVMGSIRQMPRDKSYASSVTIKTIVTHLSNNVCCNLSSFEYINIG